MQYEGAFNLVDITISNNVFYPNDIAIDPGWIVVFENQDNQDHRIQFKTGEDDPNEEHDHPVVSHEITHILQPTKHWILSFLVSGLYPYECLLHGENGQVYVRYSFYTAVKKLYIN